MRLTELEDLSAGHRSQNTMVAFIYPLGVLPGGSSVCCSSRISPRFSPPTPLFCPSFLRLSPVVVVVVLGSFVSLRFRFVFAPTSIWMDKQITGVLYFAAVFAHRWLPLPSYRAKAKLVFALTLPVVVSTIQQDFAGICGVV